MQTQRDHVHAQQFLMGRMTSGLVLAEPSSIEVPARRALLGLIIGLVLSLVAALGFGLYGLLFPGGSKDWQVPGAILVEEESGTRYVYLDGKLRPTLNMASALLLTSGAGSHVELINRASLEGVPRGAPIGIPGAPQVVPSQADLLSGPWLLCLPDSVGNAGSTPPEADSVVGINLDPAADATPLGPKTGALVQDSDGTMYLILDAVRYPISAPPMLDVLGMADAPTPVAPGHWLANLEQGPTIGPAPIEGTGQSGPAVAGVTYEVGQLFRQPALNGTEQLFVLLQDGLAPVSELEFALLAVEQGAAAPVELTAVEVAAAPRSPDRSLTGQRLPDLAGVRPADGDGSALCLRQRPGGGKQVSTVVSVPREQAAIGPQGRAGVRVPPGTGMLATVAASGDEAERQQPLYLITALGAKYPLVGSDTIGALGYSGSPTPLPPEMLEALPTGPMLTTRAPGLI